MEPVRALTESASVVNTYCSIAVTTYRGQVETTVTIGLRVPIILCTLLIDTDLSVEQKWQMLQVGRAEN